MAEGTIEGVLKSGIYDRSLSVAALITGAIGVLCIVFSLADWSRMSLMGMSSQALNLALFCAGLIFLFITFVLWMWLRTHDIRRMRYLALMGAFLLATVAIGFTIGRFIATGRVL